MKIDGNLPIAKLAADVPGAMAIFESLGIDYRMRELRVRLADSNDVSPRCGQTLDDLATLEAHLHEYIFLENGILFPRASAFAEQATGSPIR